MLADAEPMADVEHAAEQHRLQRDRQRGNGERRHEQRRNADAGERERLSKRRPHHRDGRLDRTAQLDRKPRYRQGVPPTRRGEALDTDQHRAGEEQLVFAFGARGGGPYRPEPLGTREPSTPPEARARSGLCALPSRRIPPLSATFSSMRTTARVRRSCARSGRRPFARGALRRRWRTGPSCGCAGKAAPGMHRRRPSRATPARRPACGAGVHLAEQGGARHPAPAHAWVHHLNEAAVQAP